MGKTCKYQKKYLSLRCQNVVRGRERFAFVAKFGRERFAFVAKFKLDLSDHHTRT